MPRLLLAACAALALVVTGALVPRASGTLDARALKPASAHAAPWPAWAHGATTAAAPEKTDQRADAMASPNAGERQLTAEHLGLTEPALAAAAPPWVEQALFLGAESLSGRAQPVLSPPPRFF